MVIAALGSGMNGNAMWHVPHQEGYKIMEGVNVFVTRKKSMDRYLTLINNLILSLGTATCKRLKFSKDMPVKCHW